MSLPSRALRRVQLGQLARVRHVLAAALPVGLPSQGPCVLQRAPSAACRLRTYATSPFAPSSSPAPQFPDPASSDREREHDKKGSEAKGERRSGPGGMFPSFTNSPALDAALTTVVGLFLVFGSGTAYLAWYKFITLRRIEKAFEPGYDPALDLSTNRTRRSRLHQARGVYAKDEDDEGHIVREEQEIVDRIVRGEEVGGYYVLMGSKGTGKGTMLLDAMRAVEADGAAFVEAHPDLEVFRLRFGKALNYDFFEDWQGGLFSRADPRNGGPSLDIERACSKLEKVGLRYARKRGRPLVLIFNNIHLFPNDDEGRKLLHQLQQRAEAWAEAGIVTCVFSSDDFWPYDMMRKNANRMKILSVYDLPHASALRALTLLREDVAPTAPALDPEVVSEVVRLVGGRTAYLSRCARAKDPLAEARFMVRSEREWLMSQIGLIPDVDDDCMDEQKWCSCSWLLLRQLASPTTLQEPAGQPLTSSSPTTLAQAPDDGAESDERQLGYVTYGRARVLMTRADFIMPLDHLNIISVDVNHHVRPDSHVTLNAIRSIVSEEGFDDLLDNVRDRIDEIESLHRTRENTVKEPVRVRPWKKGRQRGIEIVGLGSTSDPDDGEGDDASSAESKASWWPFGRGSGSSLSTTPTTTTSAAKAKADTMEAED